MESIKIQTHVGDDGLLMVNLPIVNQDLEVMVIYQTCQKRNHSESKRRLTELRGQYGGKIFSDSVELLREDRDRE